MDPFLGFLLRKVHGAFSRDTLKLVGWSRRTRKSSDFHTRPLPFLLRTIPLFLSSGVPSSYPKLHCFLILKLPHMTLLINPPAKKKQPNINRVRKILHGVQREDSDDELGDEDLPWEWIYPKEPEVVDPAIADQGRSRIGAKMGQFNIGIGDCVLIKGEGLQGEAYVGMICEFDEEEGKIEDGDGVEMMANVMWFSTEFEVKNKEKKRMDYLPVCFFVPCLHVQYADFENRMNFTSTPPIIVFLCHR